MILRRSPTCARVRAASLVAGAVAATLSLGSIAAGKPVKPSPTVGDLKPRSVEIRPEQKVDASAARAIDNYRRYLDMKDADPELRAEALRRLGDLNLEVGELERIEKEANAIDAAGAEAIELYTSLLKAYPDYPRNDQVLYQLARAYETTGQPEKALATLDQVVERYPELVQMDEVDFRRGEILFSNKRYGDAEQAYRRALDRGPDGAFHSQSLYKHGWSLFKQGRNEESLPSFAGVLDRNLTDPGEGNRLRSIDAMSRPDRELVEDTLRVMSITFSYMEGADSLGQFISGRGDTPYTYLLYSRLGDLYVEKQRFQDAANVYRAFVAGNAADENAPVLAMQAIEAYRKGGFDQLVLEGKRDYIERYNFAGEFWQGRERSKYSQVVAELKTNMKDVATYYHATAQKSKRTEDYQTASRWYRDYLASFPDDPESAATNYLLAETLFEGRQYAEASAEYERTAYIYPRGPRSAAAGYASIVAYQKQREALAGEAQAQWHLRQIDAGIKFAQAFPEHPDAGGVITRAAQDVFALKDLPRAIEVANLVLAQQPTVDAPKQRIAWTIIGQANFDQGVFDGAEAAFARARELAPGSDPLRKDLSERLAASVYKQAESRREQGDGTGAVDAFLRVAALSPDAAVRATAEYDAAAQLITMKNWSRAIPVLEGYRRSYPKDARQPDVTRNLAVAYAEAGRPADAAVEFERIAASPTEERAIQREALLSAADLYEKAGNRGRTGAMLEKFVAQFPAPVAPAIDARQRLVEISAQAGDRARQQFWQKEIVKADAAAGAERTDRSRVLAARAQLALAAPARDAFRDIRLTAPLKRSLDAKKKALDAALLGYRAAVDYRVGDVTTSATADMADLYRRLGQDLMKSERPKNLDADAREQYDLLLEEQAFPFEEQAIELHELNAGRVREGLYDDGVRRSYAALAELKPARYGKTELVQEQLQGVDPKVSDALRQRKAGDLAGAEGVLRAVAEQSATPGAPLLTELGVTQRQLGKFEDALASYSRAVAENPDYPPANRNLAILLDLYLDDAARALPYIERYQSQVGDDKLARAWVADIRQRAGKAAAPNAGPDGGSPGAAADAPATNDPSATAPATAPEPASAPAPAAPPGGQS